MQACMPSSSLVCSWLRCLVGGDTPWKCRVERFISSVDSEDLGLAVSEQELEVDVPIFAPHLPPSMHFPDIVGKWP